MIVFRVEAIIYLLLYNLHDCTFKSKTDELEMGKEKRAFLVLFILSEGIFFNICVLSQCMVY